MTRAIALGAFDGLHTAHMAVLEAAARQRDSGFAPAVLLFDQHPQQALTGLAPPRLLADGERDCRLRALGLELLRARFGEIKDMPPRAFFEEILMRRFRAGALCCGYDFRFGAGARGDAPALQTLCDAHGVRLQTTPEIDYGGAPVSSTRIRQALAQGGLAGANAMLGRPFGYAFPVERGGQVGRTLGAPTINQAFPAGFAVPRYGVYASQAFVGDAWLPGVTNIGVRPSFGGSELRSETHVIGFAGDLYGRRVPVRLLRFLRPERKFGSIEELKGQIAADIQNAQMEVRA
ncbi:MAG: riboflavin biosynthesis protein RibF [Oscillospiraceae bacterium]|jgi:riboflavin kinase/FMN adenylyltransferase|nr:riboflavin biosynthesis protein RibF [Oscillospiraceae bacterium]